MPLPLCVPPARAAAAAQHRRPDSLRPWPAVMSTPAEAAPSRTLVIGGAGAIGRRLIAAITARSGPGSVVAGLRSTPLSPELAQDVICEFGIDVRNEDTIRALLQEYASTVDVIWNLAAPLSVDTAKDPTVAYDVVVGGMERLLRCMKEVGLSKLCFSDSIGSFGAEVR
eukprot:COSAG05_NODE_2295_length_3264_cov_2.986730_6_plen_169_part_00